MCGIYGGFSFGDARLNRSQMMSMASTLKHRGPDAQGFEILGRAGIGNLRLSIIDLSSASNQPFMGEDGNIAVVQNGEIYNYIELREELRRSGVRFRSGGDTEVILKAYEAWGSDFVERLNGMFAIAIYDKKIEKLLLYRDRLGVKPLFVCLSEASGYLWFASEIKALLKVLPTPKANFDAIAQFFALNYVPPPQTAFDGILHLEPGCKAEISTKGMIISKYWELAKTTPEPAISETEAIASIMELLDDATKIRMRSDAKYGAFLSGGLDSSSIVGLMSRHKRSPVSTFSIGFEDVRFDESPYAEAASKRFGTDHHSQNASYEIKKLWPEFIWHVDQPHGDVSFMPTLQVSELASQKVKMVLTGDGGDELFGGYEKYTNYLQHYKGDVELGDSFARTTGLISNQDYARELLGGELRDAFIDTNPYRGLSQKFEEVAHQDPTNQILYADTTTLLPGNNLVKPDRMAMARSLEVRSPFLDYRLAEFAFRIPGRMKISGYETKSLLKKAVRSLIGDELAYRKKQMFTVPIGEWLKFELKEFSHNIILNGSVVEKGLINKECAYKMLDSHVHSERNYTREIRALISLEIWFRLFQEGQTIEEVIAAKT